MKRLLTQCLRSPLYRPINISTQAGMGSHALIKEIAQSIGYTVNHVSLDELELFDVSPLGSLEDKYFKNITTPTILVLTDFDRGLNVVQNQVFDLIFNHNNDNLKVVVITYESSKGFVVSPLMERFDTVRLTNDYLKDAA